MFGASLVVGTGCLRCLRCLRHHSVVEQEDGEVRNGGGAFDSS